MSKVGKNLPSAISDSNGDLESNNSVSRPSPNADRLAAQAVARFVIGNIPENVRNWVKNRQEVFSLRDVAAACFKGKKLTRSMETRLGIMFKKLGCTRFDRNTASGRKWYIPPEATIETTPHPGRGSI